MSESRFARHEPCPDCGSSDARAVYTSGVRHCFSCGVSTPPEVEAGDEGTPVEAPGRVLLPRQSRGLPSLDYRGVAARRLTEDTCRLFQYGYCVLGGDTVQAATYTDRNGRPVAMKVRTRDKRFSWIGDPKAAESLYGRRLWREGGRRVVVTEGEVDALSTAQALGNRWPVVSLKDGAGSAERCFRENVEWLESFDEVVLLFDEDEEGRKAVAAAAPILSPGKARVARLPLKDASELLKAGRDRDLVRAVMFETRAWRPDGVLEGDTLWDRVIQEPPSIAVEYPWSGLRFKLRGLRRKEIVTICGGTGIGKSTIARELGLHLLQAGERVGWIALEESARDTVLAMLSAIRGVNGRLGTPDWDELRPVWEEHLAGKLVCYDHFGSLEAKKLLGTMRYMVKGLECGWIGLDHVTIAVSGLETDNERKDLDVLMTNARALVEETRCGMILVSQLKRRGQGPQYEEGAVPRLSDLRGSSMLEQTSDVVVAASRSQATGDNALELHVLKNRPLSVTGPAGTLEWDQEAGRYVELTLDPVEETP